ncbi:MAG: nitrogen regulation protein NR(II) [Pseudomonadales bacterium]
MRSDSIALHLLDNLTTAILVLNDELQISYMNQAAEELLDCSDTRAVGQHLANLMRGDTEQLDKLEQQIQDGRPFTRRAWKLAILGSKEITVDLAVTPLHHLDRLRSSKHNNRSSDNNKAHRVLLELQVLDRMLRISREETLVSSQSTSRSLVRGLAHEIKNPLGGLRGAAQLLAKELPQAHLQDYTTVIIEEADRLRNLVDKMLGPNQLSEKYPVNIHEVLERCSTLIQAEKRLRIHIDRDYDPSIPDLIGDSEQLIQAVLNIMRNSRQALASLGPHHKSVIRLRTRIIRQFTIAQHRHKLVVRVDITDNGPGIDPDLLEAVFYPMISGRPEGTGLGLSISQSILHQHQGLIECTSQPGETVFSLLIPLEPSNAK